MQRSATSFPKPGCSSKAPTMAMAPQIFSSSSQLEGPYQLAELDQLCGWPNTFSYPLQSSFNKICQPISAKTDNHSSVPAKKTRLTMDQTKSLENSFAIDNKLEPERKKTLALALGLQPRQVAIWYQNRRARTKTKHLEDKYEALNMQYQKVLQDKRKLEEEVNTLREEVQGFKDKAKLKEECKMLQTIHKDNSLLSANNNYSFSANEAEQHTVFGQGNSYQRIYSENDSNESTQNQPAFSANSTPSYQNCNQEKRLPCQQAIDSKGMQVHEWQDKSLMTHNQASEFTLENHLHCKEQQQQEFLQHLQYQCGFGCNRNMAGDVKTGSHEYVGIPCSSIAHFEGSYILDDYRFKLDDDDA